ncbi:MAG TPA: enoyl-CoA hydratase/isomerase family protein [Dehalococcoidia bacterium]|nr:enoyl-CoA hydratase/isomerase family protein [Dehalococcoidia bacterium]HLB29795.1 enoyl-CoA hydratase/isomerase family protein [Dehalococcoidia bacterium]
MATYETVLYERQGNIAHISLNRPERLNAFNEAMIGELQSALKEAEADDDVKVVILKGSGRAFSAGIDLSIVFLVYGGGTRKDDPKPSQRSRLHWDRLVFHDLLKTILYCWKPTIAQVQGYCIGEAFYVQMACDLTIAAEDAKMGHSEQRLGFAGAHPMIIPEVLLIGQKRMRELSLTGRLITAREAEAWGLINRAVPPEQLEAEVERTAQAVCLLPRDGLAVGKAQTHLAYEALGMTTSFVQGYIGHTLFTNLRWEEGEYNFIRERREKGAKAAFHERDARYGQYGY